MRSDLTFRFRIELGGQPCPARWRLRVCGFVARLLRVPVTVVRDDIHSSR